MKRLLLILLALGATACESGTEPNPEFALNFNVAPVDTLMIGDTVFFQGVNLGWELLRNLPNSHPISVEAQPGAIRVFGSYVTPCTSPAPFAKVQRSGDLITLIINYEEAGVCLTALHGWTYEALFMNVPAGAYHLRVEHYRDDLRPAGGVVFEQQIDVLEQQVNVP